MDEPTTGLHPADVDKQMAQLQGLVDAGSTVVVVEHDMRVVSAATGSSTSAPVWVKPAGKSLPAVYRAK